MQDLTRCGDFGGPRQPVLDLVLRHRARSVGRAQRPGQPGRRQDHGRSRRRAAGGHRRRSRGRAGRAAIPVAGIKADQLVDTFTQARAGGARRHDAIDIMAPDGTPVVRRGRRARSRNCSIQRARRDHRLRPLARPALDLLLRASVGLCAGPCRRAAGQARPADRPGRPYRRCQSRRPASPFRDQPDGAGREMVARDADQSLSAACRKEGQRLEAPTSRARRADPSAALSIQFSRQAIP